MHGLARRMAASLTHRGPDDEGTWADPESGAAFGFRRLSIVDLSPAGAQPMTSASGRYVLVFNGEIYNHVRLRERLQSEGRAPSWRGHSDTEVLLACIDAWGLRKAVESFIGMFVFALWDTEERRMSLVRDRAGVKPLYYAATPRSLLFASELKAIAAHPEFEAAIDPVAAALYGRLRYIPAPYSIYAGVRKLRPGTIASVNASGALEEETYWDAAGVAERAAAAPFEGSDADAVEALEVLLSDSVMLRMIADVPLGVLLSGGVDSSLIASLMTRHSGSRIHTFTIGFEDPRFDEARFGREVARHLGADHRELYVTAADALALVPELPRIYDEPFADSSALPTYLVSRLARSSVTVALSGDGADELLAGYHHHFLGRRMQRRVQRVPRFARPATGWLLRRFGRSARAQRLGSALVQDDALAAYAANVTLDPLIGAGVDAAEALALPRPRLNDPTDNVMFADFTRYLPDDILTKVDRASMAVSLEVRTPFLDHRVIELAWSMPLALKIRDDRGKWIERELLRRFLPDELVDREKQGFGLPLAEWLRGPLRDWAESLIAAMDADFVDVGGVRRNWREHLAGADREAALWTALMFQAWRQPA